MLADKRDKNGEIGRRAAVKKKPIGKMKKSRFWC